MPAVAFGVASWPPRAPTASTYTYDNPPGAVHVCCALVQPNVAITPVVVGTAVTCADFGVSRPAESTTLTR